MEIEEERRGGVVREMGLTTGFTRVFPGQSPVPIGLRTLVAAFVLQSLLIKPKEIAVEVEEQTLKEVKLGLGTVERAVTGYR